MQVAVRDVDGAAVAVCRRFLCHRQRGRQVEHALVVQVGLEGAVAAGAELNVDEAAGSIDQRAGEDRQVTEGMLGVIGQLDGPEVGEAVSH